MLYTTGTKYYAGYIFKVYVSEDPELLKLEEAADYYKIIYIKTGTCHFVLNQKDYVITGSHALRLNDADRISILESSGLSVKIIFFRPEIINSNLNIDVINNPTVKLTLTENQDLYYLEQFRYNASDSDKLLHLSAMDSAIMEERIDKLNVQLTRQETSFWPCRSRSYMFEILFALVRQETPADNAAGGYPREHSGLAVSIIYYLQTRYNRKITIDDLVDEFHMNRTTLQTEFKKYTGQSINQYLVRLRLNMAAKMLRDTTLSLKEICDRTGFSDVSYFSKAFKAKLNLTPSGYRDINKAKS